MDRVRAYKSESAATGGTDSQNRPFPVVLDPHEDALDARGYFFQEPGSNDASVGIFRTNGGMVFRDNAVGGEVSLAELAEPRTRFWVKDFFSVSASNPVVITQPDGSPLNPAFTYRFRIHTYGTGNQTGAVYLAWTTDGAWQVRASATTHTNSNHPQLRVTAGNEVELFTAHASGYSIRVHAEAITNTTGQPSPFVWGADYGWARDRNTLSYEDGDVSVGQFLEVGGGIRGSTLAARVKGLSFIQAGYVEESPVNFRFDQDCLRYVNRWGTATITAPDFTATEIDRLFSVYASFANLNGKPDGTSIEVTGLNITSSNSGTFWPYVLMHIHNANVDVKIEILKAGGGAWQVAYEGTPSPYVIAQYNSGAGALAGVRWTFFNGAAPGQPFAQNTYVRSLGCINRNGAAYQWSVIRGGDTMYGDLRWDHGGVVVKSMPLSNLGLTLGWDADGGRVQTYESKPLYLNRAGNAVLVGNVTSPTQDKLQVQGNVRASGYVQISNGNLILGSSADTEVFRSAAATATIRDKLIVGSGVGLGNLHVRGASTFDDDVAMDQYLTVAKDVDVVGAVSASDVNASGTVSAYRGIFQFHRPPVSAGVPTPQPGQLSGDQVWDSNSNKLYAYNGTAFVEVGGGSSYVLPAASTTVRGGIRVGSNLEISSTDILSVKSSLSGISKITLVDGPESVEIVAEDLTGGARLNVSTGISALGQLRGTSLSIGGRATIAGQIEASGDIIMTSDIVFASGGLSSASHTGGFLGLPVNAGVPAPQPYTGTGHAVFDSTNKRLYVADTPTSFVEIGGADSHNHDGRYLKESGGFMTGPIEFGIDEGIIFETGNAGGKKLKGGTNGVILENNFHVEGLITAEALGVPTTAGVPPHVPGTPAGRLAANTSSNLLYLSTGSGWLAMVPSTRTISTAASSGLTGGGSLSSNRSLAVNFGGTGTANTVARSDHNHDGAYVPIGSPTAGKVWFNSYNAPVATRGMFAPPNATGQPSVTGTEESGALVWDALAGNLYGYHAGSNQYKLLSGGGAPPPQDLEFSRIQTVFTFNPASPDGFKWVFTNDPDEFVQDSPIFRIKANLENAQYARLSAYLIYNDVSESILMVEASDDGGMNWQPLGNGQFGWGGPDVMMEVGGPSSEASRLGGDAHMLSSEWEEIDPQFTRSHETWLRVVAVNIKSAGGDVDVVLGAVKLEVAYAAVK